jgi:hypothetical protein
LTLRHISKYNLLTILCQVFLELIWNFIKVNSFATKCFDSQLQWHIIIVQSNIIAYSALSPEWVNTLSYLRIDGLRNTIKVSFSIRLDACGQGGAYMKLRMRFRLAWTVNPPEAE